MSIRVTFCDLIPPVNRSTLHVGVPSAIGVALVVSSNLTGGDVGAGTTVLRCPWNTTELPSIFLPSRHNYQASAGCSRLDVLAWYCLGSLSLLWSNLRNLRNLRAARFVNIPPLYGPYHRSCACFARPTPRLETMSPCCVSLLRLSVSSGGW